MSQYRGYFVPSGLDPIGNFVCQKEKCKCVKGQMQFLPYQDHSDVIRGKNGEFASGGQQPVKRLLGGTGDIKKCKFRRWVIDWARDKIEIFRNDKRWMKDDPIPDTIDFARQEEENGVRFWLWQETDYPGLVTKRTLAPARKNAIYISYAVDSDGKVPMSCCFMYYLKLRTFAKRQKDGAYSTAEIDYLGILSEETCPVIAARLEKNNSAPPSNLEDIRKKLDPQEFK